MLVCERHPELEKCRQLAAFKYLERKSQIPNEALIGIVLFSADPFSLAIPAHISKILK